MAMTARTPATSSPVELRLAGDDQVARPPGRWRDLSVFDEGVGAEDEGDEPQDGGRHRDENPPGGIAGLGDDLHPGGDEEDGQADPEHHSQQVPHPDQVVPYPRFPQGPWISLIAGREFQPGAESCPTPGWPNGRRASWPCSPEAQVVLAETRGELVLSSRARESDTVDHPDRGRGQWRPHGQGPHCALRQLDGGQAPKGSGNQFR